MTVSLKETLNADIKSAMKSGQKKKLAALRLISAAIKQHDVDNRVELDEDGSIDLLNRMVKQRREAIIQFEKAERDDLVATETFELEIVKSYLPAQLTREEIENHLETAIQECKAESPKDMGKVMNILKASLKGRADMSAVSKRVKELLQP
jgi:uncharacterized protein YqeY